MESLGEVRALCDEIGLVTRWSTPARRRLGIWQEPAERAALRAA